MTCHDCHIEFTPIETTDLDYPRCPKCEEKAMRELIDERRHPDQGTA